MSTLPVDPGGPDLNAVLTRLNALRPLKRTEAALFESLASSCRVLEPGETLFDEGREINRAAYVVSGWALRQRELEDGRRQIVGFVLPGEGVGLCRRPRPLAFTSTVALTRLTILDATPVMVEEEAVAEGLSDVLNRAAALDEHRLISHVVRLGRLTAYERICNLLLELADRLQLVGLATRHAMPLPMTQETLADMLGLSVVHTNRTLKQLARDGLVEVTGGMARLHDLPRLRKAGLYEGPPQI